MYHYNFLDNTLCIIQKSYKNYTINRQNTTGHRAEDVIKDPSFLNVGDNKYRAYRQSEVADVISKMIASAEGKISSRVSWSSPPIRSERVGVYIVTIPFVFT